MGRPIDSSCAVAMGYFSLLPSRVCCTRTLYFSTGGAFPGAGLCLKRGAYNPSRFHFSQLPNSNQPHPPRLTTNQQCLPTTTHARAHRGTRRPAARTLRRTRSLRCRRILTHQRASQTRRRSGRRRRSFSSARRRPGRRLRRLCALTTTTCPSTTARLCPWPRHKEHTKSLVLPLSSRWCHHTVLARV